MDECCFGINYRRLTHRAKVLDVYARDAVPVLTAESTIASSLLPADNIKADRLK